MLYRNPSRLRSVVYWTFGLSLALVLCIGALTPEPEHYVAYGDCPEWRIPHAPQAEVRSGFVYVNGVGTPPLLEYDAICNLGHAVASIGVTPGFAADPLVWVTNVKNRTRVEELLDADRATTPRVVVGAWVSGQRFPPPADIVESIRAARNIRRRFPAGARMNPDAHVLARRIRSEIADGRRVVLLAHSQGNLVIHEALQILALTAPPGEMQKMMRCTGVVGLASPAAFPIRGDVASASIMVRGDVIYSPIVRWITGVRPSERDIVTTSRSPAARREFRPSTVGTNISLHEVNGSYFGQPETRRRIVRALDSIYGVLSERSCDPVPHPRITGTWRGPAATAGEGTLRLRVDGQNVHGTWVPGSSGREHNVAVQLVSRRHMRVAFAVPDTTVDVYLIGPDAAGYRVKVRDTTDLQQGGRRYLDPSR